MKESPEPASRAVLEIPESARAACLAQVEKAKKAGAVAIGADVTHGVVIISFPKPLDYVTFEPATVKLLIHRLREALNEIEVDPV